MVTPELTNYIKGEFAKGKTREMIRATLISEGGWGEADLNDAFRIAIPMQNFTTNPSPIQSNPTVSSVTQHNPLQNNMGRNSFTQSNFMKDGAMHNSFQSSSTPKSYKMLLITFLFVIVGGAVALWYFRPLFITDTINSISSSLFTPPVEDTNTTPPVDDTIVAEIPPVVVKDCGTSASPDPKNSKTYKDNKT